MPKINLYNHIIIFGNLSTQWAVGLRARDTHSVMSVWDVVVPDHNSKVSNATKLAVGLSCGDLKMRWVRIEK